MTADVYVYIMNKYLISLYRFTSSYHIILKTSPDHGDLEQRQGCCTLSQDSMTPMYCAICHIYLCKDFVEKHLSDYSNIHKVVSLKQQCITPNYPKGRQHNNINSIVNNMILLFVHSAFLGNIQDINHLTFKKPSKAKTEDLQRNQQELEKIIYSIYKEIAPNIQVQLEVLGARSQIIPPAKKILKLKYFCITNSGCFFAKITSITHSHVIRNLCVK